MKTAPVLALSLFAIAVSPAAQAEVGFFAYTTLTDGGSAQVARPSGNVVDYGLNYLLEVSPTEVAPGCGISMTKSEAAALGDLYAWIASDESPLAVDETIAIGGSGHVRVIRSPTSMYIETTVDDGTSPTSISSDCYSNMTLPESARIGSWLLAAVSPSH